MLICLSGKSGSGKSYVSSLFSSYSNNFLSIDIDTISHIVINYKEVADKLVQAFGKIIWKNEEIDRKALGKIVFNSKEKMQQLEDITWPVMEVEIDKIIKSNPNKIILLDWQLLPKTKYFKECDIKILVTAPLQIRMKRAMERDSITEEKFLERENAFLLVNESDFDYVILNLDKEKTKEEVYQIYEKSIIHR